MAETSCALGMLPQQLRLQSGLGALTFGKKLFVRRKAIGHSEEAFENLWAKHSTALIGRKSVTTTRHAGKACLRACPEGKA